MLVRVYQAVLGVIVVWFIAAALLGWKSPAIFAGGSGGRGGGFFGGGAFFGGK